MRLLRVELRRLFSRRLVVMVMIGGLVLSGLLLLGVWRASQPMPAAERERAQAEYQRALADWEEHGDEQIAQCLEDEEREAELLGEEMDFGCETMTAPQPEWFFYDAQPLDVSLPGALSGHAYLLVFLALLVGATFTAAEFSTGSISSWLTFEPRRLRVYTSKVLAASIGIVPVLVLAVAVVVTGAWIIATALRLAGGMDGTAWSDVAATSLRVLALAVLAAAVGAALGVLLRHTAAVLGVVVGYVVVVENVFGSALGRFQPWLVLKNVEAWLHAGTSYYVERCTTDPAGTTCDVVEHTLGLGQSVVYVVTASVLVAAAGALVFRRRDAV